MSTEPSHSRNSATDTLAHELKRICGSDAVATDLATLELYSQDIYSAAEHLVACVVRPSSTPMLRDVVSSVTQRGHAIVARGAGASYTGGYLSPEPNSVAIDLHDLNRIVDLNDCDGYVTVEAGVTWAQLHEALLERGLRTPFWGPLSGLKSTIGGGLSQNNAFFGSGVYGPSSDSVLSVSVVLANGDLLRTGSAARQNGHPFFRHFGPDLTGLFLGDTGALGIKAEATLRLIPAPAAEDYVSFSFTNADDFLAAGSDIARQGLACELFGFDPALQGLRLKRASILEDAKRLVSVAKKQHNVIKGAAEAAKVAAAGRRFVADDAFSLHAVCEGITETSVREQLIVVRRLAREHGGKEIENSIPKLMRADPFQPLNNVVGPSGERWVPVHGIVPHSRAQAVWRAIDELFDTLAAEFHQHEIKTGILLTTLSTTGVLIEPVFFWPDALMPIHEQTAEASYLARLPRREANPTAAAVVGKARRGVIEIFSAHQGAHFQIGRTYPFGEVIEDRAAASVRGLKTLLDPTNRINPSALQIG